MHTIESHSLEDLLAGRPVEVAVVEDTPEEPKPLRSATPPRRSKLPGSPPAEEAEPEKTEGVTDAD